MKAKKGFTLIELMIVIAIIAILAAVLIPRAGAMKDSARNSGVLTNVNAVRGYLETKTGINFISTAAALRTSMNATFTGTSAFTNPFTGASSATAASVDALTGAGTAAVSVYDVGAGSSVATSTTGTPAAANRGIVFVGVCSDGYLVFGVDNAGNAVDIQRVSEN